MLFFSNFIPFSRQSEEIKRLEKIGTFYKERNADLLMTLRINKDIIYQLLTHTMGDFENKREKGSAAKQTLPSQNNSLSLSVNGLSMSSVSAYGLNSVINDLRKENSILTDQNERLSSKLQALVHQVLSIILIIIIFFFRQGNISNKLKK